MMIRLPKKVTRGDQDRIVEMETGVGMLGSLLISQNLMGLVWIRKGSSIGWLLLKRCLSSERLRGRASTWWQQLKMSRNRLGKSRIVTWAKMKKCLRDTFLPHNVQRLMYHRLQNLKQGSKSVDEYTTEFYHLVARNDIQETDEQLVARYIGGLRVQIMDSVNLFDPLTVAEAYQRALAFEKQNCRVGGSYSPTPAGGNSGSGSGGPRVVPSQQRSGANNTGLTSKGASSSGVKCFKCGETGHQQVDCK
ncbi:uncharacterized protein LOC143634710 [Bidens hawaiensis]|uniref:uncharacterized protein LOC143634710 n=1 Tax=Bidens hawaiensis TaxID=980011 RepID=UPI00404AC107